MKTSNILVSIAVFATVVAVVIYDLFIREVYGSGVYKIPYYTYMSLPYKDFDKVDILSSTTANVKFVQGPFSVRMAPGAADYVNIRKDEKRLVISVIFSGNYRSDPDEYALVISCPALKEVTAGATYYVGRRAITDTVVKDDWRMRKVVIEGFSQDSISIAEDYGSTVVLKNNNIRKFHAVIGTSPGSGSDLAVDASNHILNCTVTAEHKSRFFLENAGIGNLHYDIGDSAKIVVSGDAQHLLNNSKKGLK